MWKQLKGVFGKKEAEVPKEILDAKAQATARKEPFVEVISVNFDKENPVTVTLNLNGMKSLLSICVKQATQGTPRRDCRQLVYTTLSWHWC